MAVDHGAMLMLLIVFWVLAGTIFVVGLGRAAAMEPTGPIASRPDAEIEAAA